MTRPARFRLLALAALSAAPAGCGGGKDDAPAGVTDAEAVEQCVASVDDRKEVLQTFPRAWAGGAAPPPAELRKYQAYSFQAGGPPRVTGDEATVPVRILKRGAEVATKDWTVVREGEAWKLKSAPLP